jgi:hypothetical protein
VLISVAHLLDRTRHRRRRADELRELRQRMLRAGRHHDPVLIELAQKLRGLRQELAALFDSIRSCSRCAQGHPLPYGYWPGGHCCGGRTEELFPDDELAALALANTSPFALRAPRGEQAGCVFRGPTGCSLAAVDRPNLCVRYTCRTLEPELGERPEDAQIAELQGQMLDTFETFCARRRRLLESDRDAT